MNIYLFDSIEAHENLLPLSFTRPLADFRCGILTIRQKWEKYLHYDCRYLPVEYLQTKYGAPDHNNDTALFIAGNLLPHTRLADIILHLNLGECLTYYGTPLAFKGSLKDFEEHHWNEKEFHGEASLINYLYDIFLLNPSQISSDFSLITQARKSKPLPDCVRCLCSSGKSINLEKNIFIEEGAVVECATINIDEGPVYIGKNAVLMEGSCIRGPFALCEGAEVRMGAKIYEGTTIGPHCKVGGEISNTVFFAYSNKTHDGYLGNAVIGEWCNIGAGTNASNLKNDYSLIRLWNYRTHSFMRTQLQFCGLIMGDHSKIGVNCMINTATVIGVGVNLHGCGFPRAYLANFCEGSPASGFSQMPLTKFLDIAERVLSRRDLSLSKDDMEILSYIYNSGE